MVPHNYKQLAVFENEICIAVTGFWTGTKLWSGKYIEIDNFIVHPEHRSKGLGKMMTDYIDVKAKEENCSMIVLDALQEILLRIVLLQSRVWPKRLSFVKNLMKKGYLKFFMMGYIKQIVVLILTAGSLSFVPLNRIIIWIFHKK
jgi:ribosomal protein S18 acetylase RimI-like enzyme